MELLTWPIILLWDLFQIVIILAIYFIVARWIFRRAKSWCQKQSVPQSEAPTVPMGNQKRKDVRYI